MVQATVMMKDGEVKQVTANDFGQLFASLKDTDFVAVKGKTIKEEGANQNEAVRD